MNNQRRKELAAATERLREVNALLTSLKETVECLRDEEQEYMDNMPESFQSSEKYQASEASVDAMDSAIDMMEDLEEAAAYLEAAAE